MMNIPQIHDKNHTTLQQLYILGLEKGKKTGHLMGTELTAERTLTLRLRSRCENEIFDCGWSVWTVSSQ